MPLTDDDRQALAAMRDRADTDDDRAALDRLASTEPPPAPPGPPAPPEPEPTARVREILDGIKERTHIS